jgi:hypothetical protein
MHPELQKAIEAVTERHGAELAACERLRDFVLEITRPWAGRLLDAERQADTLVAALFARSCNTFWATLELVRIGFGEQAAMLNRSLFEDMVDAHWVTTNPELALERYGDHHDHGKMLLAEAVAKYPNYFPAEEVPEFDPDERARLDGLFGPYGTRSWTQLNLYDRTSAIEHLWNNDADQEVLRFFRDVPHRENNQTLHVTAQSLNSLVREHGADRITFKVGPGGEMLARGLFGAFWIFSQTVGLVLDYFEFSTDGAARAQLFSSAPFQHEAT